MNYCNQPLQILSNCISDAMYKTFEKTKYRNRNWEEWNKLSRDEQRERISDNTCYDGILGVDVERLPNLDEISVVYMFPQMWGSTALGFGGIGGQAITTAYTVILQHDQSSTYAVYFSGQFAYKVTRPNDKFFEDATKQCMCSVSESSKYSRDE